MSGRQTGPFVAYGPNGAVAAVLPPRGRRVAVTRTHWFRMRDAKVAEHRANRDDLGMVSSSDGRRRAAATSPGCCRPDTGCGVR